MKLFTADNCNSLSGFREVRDFLPFVFWDGYASFIQKSGKGEWLLFASEDGRKLLPVKKFKSSFLTLIQILHIPLLDGKQMQAGEEMLFLEELIRYIKQKHLADRICQPPTHVVFQGSPKQSIACGFGTYSLQLQDVSQTMLWDNLHGKHRNVIRNAQKHGVLVKSGSDQLEVFYRLYQSTMKRSSMYCESLEEFQLFYNCLGENRMICAVAYFQDLPLGALLMPYGSYAAWYVFGSSADEMTVNGAVNYLHWELICRMQAEGVKRYDFVGARLSSVVGTRLAGIQQFKSRFGSTLEKGVLWKKDINPLKCLCYDTVLSLYQKMRGIHLAGDIIDQERNK